MKSIIMQRATHCSVLQFNCIPTNWKGSIETCNIVVVSTLRSCKIPALYIHDFILGIPPEGQSLVSCLFMVSTVNIGPKCPT